MTLASSDTAPLQFKRTLRLALALPLCLAVVLMCFLGLAIREIGVAADWVEHSNNVVNKAHNLQKLIIDLETGTRGYLLYKNKVFLEPYSMGNEGVTDLTNELKAMTADNPEQQKQLQNIVDRVVAWKVEAEKTLASPSKSSLESALARKAEMDAIRGEFTIFLERENQLKADRVSALQRVSRLAIVFGFGMIGAVLLILALSTRIWFNRTVVSFETRVTQLALERQKLEAILKSIGDAVLVVDAHSRVQFINSIAENLTQWRLDDAIGRPMHEVFHIINQHTRLPAKNPVDQVLERGIVVGLANHTVLIGKNGREIPIEDSAAPIRLDKDHPIEGVILVFRDVSEKYASANELEERQRRLLANEEQLKELVEALKSANEAKSAFLANMSHEIRTPLGAIMGFTDFLKDPHLQESERANYLEIVDRNGQQLHEIINSILDLSKVEAGRLQYEARDTNLVQLIQDTGDMLQIKAKEKNIALETDFAEHMPKVVTDPTRCRQILMNIIGNAIKFTEKGQVKISAKYDRLNDSQIMVHIRVSDTGIGISTVEREHLFKTFSQADVSTTRKFGGSGLGLVLAKTFANGLGGDLVLESSTPGRGSTFLLRLKLNVAKTDIKPAMAKDTSLIPADFLKGLSILLVEDSLDNQYLIERLLKAKGATVELATNGSEGVDKASSGQHDIVLMDISMPVLDGYTATHRLRERGYRKPIVALTAHAMSEVRIKCLNVGCDDHLAKPIDSYSLYSIIGRLTGRA